MATEINTQTLLADGIKMSVFTKDVGLEHIVDGEDRRQIARNLQPHAYAMTTINNDDTSVFRDFTIEVVQGLYKPAAGESVTPDELNDLAQQGRAVAYQVVNDENGCVCINTTYDVAVYWKDLILYDKLILCYDTYSPGGDLYSFIILTTPNLDQRYRGTFTRQIETRYNNSVLSTSDLIEILP